MTHPGGRPRTVSLEPDEMIKLGQEMIDWISENKPLHISHWYSIHMFIPFKAWDTMTQRLEFIPYYERAMQIIGLQYLDKNSNVREGASQRWQRVYFKDLRAQEDADLRLKATIEQDTQKQSTDEIKQKMDDVLSQIRSTRASKREPSILD